MNSLLHLGNFDIKLLFLVIDELIECISTLSQSYLEIHFSQFELLLIVVHSCREVFVECDDICADFSHLVDRVIHVVDGIRVQCLWLELSSGRSRSSLVLHDRVKGLTFLQLSIILNQEVFKVKFSDVNVLVCVFHIICELVSQSIEDNTRLVIVLLQFLLLGLNELLCKLCWRADLDGLNYRHALVEKCHLFFSHLLEDLNTAWRVHKLLTVHAVKELLDCIGLFQLVELDNGFFPGCVKLFKFSLVWSDYILMELIKISMLYLVPLLVFHTILDKKLIDLRL